MDLYCLSDKKVGESEKIHKISDEKLKSCGFNFEVQFEKFIEFSNGKTLIAHNLDFDKRMISYSLLKIKSSNFEKFNQMSMLCSLDLARRLFPNLKSHKLANLLHEFKIEGVNSHNALDDVRAGSGFIEYARDYILQKSNELTVVINEHKSIFSKFGKNSSLIFNEIEKLKSGKINLEVLFDFYFNIVTKYGLHETDEAQLKELRYKLIRWAEKNLIEKEFDRFVSYAASILQTLKESDLILEDDKLVVSTIHKSKGLEFDYVFLPSLTDSNFPTYPIQIMESGNEKDMLIEEQKRLIYVGMTRAKKQLVIGSFEKVIRKDRVISNTSPCSFIGDLFLLMERH